jgi:hypothetical protein
MSEGSHRTVQVRSRGYGKETPPVAQRPPRPASEPRFSFGRSTSAPELSPVPRSKLNDKVCVWCVCVCVCVCVCWCVCVCVVVCIDVCVSLCVFKVASIASTRALSA